MTRVWSGGWPVASATRDCAFPRPSPSSHCPSPLLPPAPRPFPNLPPRAVADPHRRSGRLRSVDEPSTNIMSRWWMTTKVLPLTRPTVRMTRFESVTYPSAETFLADRSRPQRLPGARHSPRRHVRSGPEERAYRGGRHYPRSSLSPPMTTQVTRLEAERAGCAAYFRKPIRASGWSRPSQSRLPAHPNECETLKACRPTRRCAPKTFASRTPSGAPVAEKQTPTK